MKRTVRALAIVLATVATAHASASSPACTPCGTSWGRGAIWSSSIRHPDADVAESAFREIARLEDVLSSWDPASEVSRLNASAGRGPQPVSVDLARVAEESAAMCATSGGAFDHERWAAVAGVGLLHRVARRASAGDQPCRRLPRRMRPRERAARVSSRSRWPTAPRWISAASARDTPSIVRWRSCAHAV